MKNNLSYLIMSPLSPMSSTQMHTEKHQWLTTKSSLKFITFFLTIAILLCTSFCYSQGRITLEERDGIVIQYRIGDKKGERFDEVCKITFDIYEVEGMVINRNEDKAAIVNGTLEFEGQYCNNRYGDNGLLPGDVVPKIFPIAIVNQGNHAPRYWVNRVVTLLPKDSIWAVGTAEIKKGDHLAPPTLIYKYELISGPNTAIKSSKNEEDGEFKAINNANEAQVTSGTKDYSTLIIGKWERVHLMNTNGINEATSEPGYYTEYKANGELLHWDDQGKSDAGAQGRWSIRENILIDKSVYGVGEKEILSLNQTMLVIKTEWSKDGYAVETFKKK